MTWVIVLLVVVGFVAVLRPDRRVAARREARPGEGLQRHEVVSNVPGDMVVLRPALPTNEAQVAHGLLLSSGVKAALMPSSSSLVAYTRTVGPFMDLLVAADAVDEAEALLTDLPE